MAAAADALGCVLQPVSCCPQAIELLRQRLLPVGRDVCVVLETVGVDVDSAHEGSTAMHR